MFLLRLEGLQARDLVDKGNILDVQDPALVITVNDVDYKTRRIRHAGVNANFDEVFEINIDEDAYQNGDLMLEVEAFHKGVCGKKNVHLGKGKVSLKAAVPDMQVTTKVQIPLTFYVGMTSTAVIPDGFKKGVVYMNATVTLAKELTSKHHAKHANSFSLGHGSVWGALLQADSNSVGVEKLADDSKAEFVSHIFGDVGELIDDFQCALVTSKIMLQGRLYLTCSFICFYSNIFGKTKKLRIPYSQVRTVSKIADPVLGILYSIVVETDVKTYTFRSFWDIDESHRVIKASYDEYLANFGKSRSYSVSTTSSSTGQPSVRDRRESINIIDTEEIHGPTMSNMTSSSLGCADDQCDIHSVDNFRAEYDLCKRKIAVIMEQRLPVSVQEFADLFVEDGASFSYKMYHEMVKDTNVNMSEWSPDENVGSQYQEYSRELRFFKPVNLPGLASTRGVKYQRYKRYDDLGLFVFSSTHLEDVPAADTFSVEDTVVVRSAGTESVLIDITFEVKFVKNTFLRAVIETPTNSEMKKWLQAFYDHIYKICLEHREKMNRASPEATLALETITFDNLLAKKEDEAWKQKMASELEEVKAMLQRAELERHQQSRLMVVLLAGLLLMSLYTLYVLQSAKTL